MRGPRRFKIRQGKNYLTLSVLITALTNIFFIISKLRFGVRAPKVNNEKSLYLVFEALISLLNTCGNILFQKSFDNKEAQRTILLALKHFSILRPMLLNRISVSYKGYC